MPKKFALIVAGGSGSRMKSETPKQFLEVADKPILMHTLEVFFQFDHTIEIIVVLPETEQSRWKQLCTNFNFTISHRIADGGKTRFESVRNGLDLISDDGIVFIHDGVRPLVSYQTLKNCLDTTIEKGNALPVIPVSESVRYVDESGNKALDRSKYFLVQTPQTFRLADIKKAYNQSYSELFTDDASVLENTGTKIYTVPGNRENIKITFQEDLQMAQILIQEKL